MNLLLQDESNCEEELEETSQASFPKQAKEVWRRAGKSSKKSSQKMVKSALGRNPPSVYQMGDKVLVKCDGTDAGVRRGGRKIQQRVGQPATITEVRKSHMYRVRLEDGKILTVNISKLTSTTRMEEKERQSAARGEQCKGSTADQEQCPVTTPSQLKKAPQKGSRSMCHENSTTGN